MYEGVGYFSNKDIEIAGCDDEKKYFEVTSKFSIEILHNIVFYSPSLIA